MNKLPNLILILSFLTLFITSCNTGINGRYKGMNYHIGDEEFIFDKDGTYTYEIEWKDNPSIMGSGGTSEGEISTDAGTWWLDTSDYQGNKVTSVEYMKAPDDHVIYLAYRLNDGRFNNDQIRTKYFKVRGRDWWYPELWEDGEKAYYKAFLPF